MLWARRLAALIERPTAAIDRMRDDETEFLRKELVP